MRCKQKEHLQSKYVACDKPCEKPLQFHSQIGANYNLVPAFNFEEGPPLVIQYYSLYIQINYELSAWIVEHQLLLQRKENSKKFATLVCWPKDALSIGKGKA